MTLNAENLYDRKAINENKKYEHMNSLISSWRKRQMILGGEPDILSDSDLITHRRENKFRKLLKYLLVIGVPLTYFYYRRYYWSTLGLTVFNYLLVKTVINSYSFTNCSYSMEYAYKIRINSLRTYNAYNSIYPATPDYFWGKKQPFKDIDIINMNMDERSLPPDWYARNTQTL